MFLLAVFYCWPTFVLSLTRQRTLLFIHPPQPHPRHSQILKLCSYLSLFLSKKMGSYDVPPPDAPSWLIPLSTTLLASGIFFWLVTYILMTRRSLATSSPPIPLIPLGINLAWEAVYAIYVTDTTLERLGFAAWLAFDVPVVWATLRTSPASAKRTLLISFALGTVANAAFAHWWLAEAGRGYGDKTGKTWKGIKGRDTTELAWWSAGAAQMLLSVGCVIQVLQKGHSGGQSYGIWYVGSTFTRERGRMLTSAGYRAFWAR